MSLSPTDVQKALKGTDYPATPDELAEQARTNGADDEIVDALEGLDEDEFEGPTAVMSAIKDALGDEDE
jgi:hypothetical protein